MHCDDLHGSERACANVFIKEVLTRWADQPPPPPPPPPSLLLSLSPLPKRVGSWVLGSKGPRFTGEGRVVAARPEAMSHSPCLCDGVARRRWRRFRTSTVYVQRWGFRGLCVLGCSRVFQGVEGVFSGGEEGSFWVGLGRS